jgi:GNAT superfamily N-acetyltransferase
MSTLIRLIEESDLQIIDWSFLKHYRDEPESMLQNCFSVPIDRKRLVWVAFDGEEFQGYITLLYESFYRELRKNGILEIRDLYVLPSFRGKGIGSKLIEKVEVEAFLNFYDVGVGIGLLQADGPAQRLFVKRGYIPDGAGIFSLYITPPRFGIVPYSYTPLSSGDEVLADDLSLWFIKSQRQVFDGQIQ